MAQTGYTPISLYYSSTASAAPTSGNLVDGELAINITDGKLFYKDNSGNVQIIGYKVVPYTAGGTGLTAAPTNGQIPIGTGSGYALNTITAGSGISVTNASGSITIAATNSGTVTSVTASAPLASTGGATPNISFTGTLAVANGGTGQTSYTDGQLLIGNSTGNTLAKSTLTAGSGIAITNGSGSITIAATSSGATITNDTTTATNVYPVFAGATTGSLSTAYTSNAKLLYKPSTGEFQASELIASNGIIANNTTISASYTVATGVNAMSVGPITIASGQAVTVSSGQRWIVF